MSEEAGGQTKTPWYRTGRGVLLAIVSGFVLLLILADQKTPTQVPSLTNPGRVVGTSTTVTSSPKVEQKPTTIAPQNNQGLSNDNYYKNVDGDQVHSPAYSNSAPSGATARCGDGTYSFSRHRSGTCSHHGGVAQWL